jgi:hypothetical protein
MLAFGPCFVALCCIQSKENAITYVFENSLVTTLEKIKHKHKTGKVNSSIMLYLT